MIKQNYNKSQKFKKSQQGLSLIELMISMVVSLFLLAGVVTNFISTKNADIKREALSEMDSGASIALEALRQTISHGGYQGIDNITLDKAFYTEADHDNGGAENATCGTGSATNIWSPIAPLNDRFTQDEGSGDQISIVYRADNPCLAGEASCDTAAKQNPSAQIYYDCAGGGQDRSDPRVVACSTDSENGGMIDPTQSKIYSSFHLILDPGNVNDRALFCRGSRGDSQIISDNIEAIQYLYGVTDNNGLTYYRDASQVETNNQWGEVTSVQVGVLMRSSRQNVLDQASTKTSYNLLETPINIAAGDLRRLFKVYTTTINLENVSIGEIL